MQNLLERLQRLRLVLARNGPSPGRDGVAPMNIIVCIMRGAGPDNLELHQGLKSLRQGGQVVRDEPLPFPRRRGEQFGPGLLRQERGEESEDLARVRQAMVLDIPVD